MAVLISLNSQGLRSPDRRKTAFFYFQRHRLDIILFQETHWIVDMEMQIQRVNGTERLFLIMARIPLEVLPFLFIHGLIMLRDKHEVTMKVAF